MDTIELIERIEYAIHDYHKNPKNSYSSIDIVDSKTRKTYNLLSNPKHLSFVLEKCCAYLNSDSFKKKKPDGEKPLTYSETLGWTVVKCLGFEDTLVTSYMVTDALVNTFEYNPKLPAADIWSAVCKELNYDRIRNRHSYDKNKIPALRPDLLTKHLPVLVKHMPETIAVSSWLFMESHSDFITVYAFQALNTYKPFIEKYLPGNSINTILKTSEIFGVHYLDALVKAINSKTGSLEEPVMETIDF